MKFISSVKNIKNNPDSRAFWELVNGILYVDIVSREPYRCTFICSFLEIDVSSNGKLLALNTVFLNRKKIRALDQKLPSNYVVGEVTFNLDWNQDYDVDFYYSKKNKIACLKFGHAAKTIYRIANSVFVGVTEEDDLAEIWITNIGRDFMYLRRLWNFLLSRIRK